MNFKLLLCIIFAITTSHLAAGEYITLCNDTPYYIDAMALDEQGVEIGKFYCLWAKAGNVGVKFDKKVDSIKLVINGKDYPFKHDHPEERPVYNIELRDNNLAIVKLLFKSNSAK